MISDILAYVSPAFDSSLSGAVSIVLLSGIGLAVGIVAGLFGVGGGFLLVPLMNVLIGIPMEIAAGSATCYIIGTSSSGVMKHLRNKNVEIRAALFLGGGSIFGAVMGDILQDFFIVTVAGGNRELFEKIMQGGFVILLALIAWVMYRTPKGKEGQKTLLQRLTIGPYVDLPLSSRYRVSIPGLVMIGVFGGILTGLMGVSGGVLFMPILTLGVGLLPHLAVGTSLAVVFTASVAAVIKKGISSPGKVSLPIAVSLLVAGTIGVRIGMFLASKITGSTLKKYFSLVAVAAGITVLLKLAL